MKTDYSRCLYFFCSLLAAIAAFVWGQPLIHDNKEAVNIIVTVFSVLAGFLVGLITITGDPSRVAALGSWRLTELNRVGVRQRLVRHRWMFVLYLLTIVLLFLSSLCREMEVFFSWIERLYFSFAVLAFLLSFRLPWTLTMAQMERYDEVIEQQRREAGISS